MPDSLGIGLSRKSANASLALASTGATLSIAAGRAPGIRSSKRPPLPASGRTASDDDCRGANGSKSSGNFGVSCEGAADPQAGDDAETPAAGGNRSAKGSLSGAGGSRRCGAGVESEREGAAGIGGAPGPSRSANGSSLDAGFAKSANGPPRSTGETSARGVDGEIRGGAETFASTLARPLVIVEASAPPPSSITSSRYPPMRTWSRCASTVVSPRPSGWPRITIGLALPTLRMV